MATSYSVRHLGAVPSTQDVAASGFEGEPLLVTAHEQTAGRGRSGSEWRTAPRAVAASLAFRPGWPPDRIPLITLVAGVAASDHIEGSAVKWPNDILVSGRKVAGLLAELEDGTVVMGMGVNLWWPDAPDGVGAICADEPPTDTGPDLAERWASTLLDLVDAGPDSWPLDRYVSRCVTIGSDIAWEPDGRGRAVDVDPTGALMVDTPGGRRRLTSAAVRHVRTA